MAGNVDTVPCCVSAGRQYTTACLYPRGDNEQAPGAKSHEPLQLDPPLPSPSSTPEEIHIPVSSNPRSKGVRESFAGRGGRAQGVDIRWFRWGFPVG